jgi:hypothetical protein
MQEINDDDRNALIWSYQLLDIIPKEENDNVDLEKALAVYLDKLIISDFNLLISILYRIDIAQENAVLALSENVNKETPGKTIAKLIIQRQKQKLYYRNFYKNKSPK